MLFVIFIYLFIYLFIVSILRLTFRLLGFGAIFRLSVIPPFHIVGSPGPQDLRANFLSQMRPVTTQDILSNA